MVNFIHKTYILPIPDKYQIFAKKLAMESGRIYPKAVSFLNRMYSNNARVSPKTLYTYMSLWTHEREFTLYSQSVQASYQQAWQAWQASWKKLKKAKAEQKSTSKIKLPHKAKKYNKVCYKEAAIHIEDGAIVLSNKRNAEKIVVLFQGLSAPPKYAELIFHADRGKYYLHVTFEIENAQPTQHNGVLSVDLGVVHPMVCFDNQNVLLYNGGVLNCKLRYRNKKLAEFQQKLSRCKKSSNQYRRLQRAKRRILHKLKNQVRDVLQKYTSHLVEYCLKSKINVVVLGNVKGIRNKAMYNKVANQKIHQWLFRKLASILANKCAFAGIRVEYISESYTSQTCPVYGTKNKPSNRNYRCSGCGFEYHREGVGVVNIWQKYTGVSLVVGHLTCPTGVRYQPHLRCPDRWNVHPVGKAA